MKSPSCVAMKFHYYEMWDIERVTRVQKFKFLVTEYTFYLHVCISVTSTPDCVSVIGPFQFQV